MHSNVPVPLPVLLVEQGVEFPLPHFLGLAEVVVEGLVLVDLVLGLGEGLGDFQVVWVGCWRWLYNNPWNQ